MRLFEKDYRLRERDDVLTRSNAVFQSIDLRIDKVEQFAAAEADGNRADVGALVANIEATFGPKAAELDDLLAGYRDGVPAANVVTDATARFTSDAEVAALQQATADEATARADADQSLSERLDTKANAASLGAHTANTGNPHATTAAQVGAYTVGETDDIVAAESQARAQAVATRLAKDQNLADLPDRQAARSALVVAPVIAAARHSVINLNAGNWVSQQNGDNQVSANGAYPADQWRLVHSHGGLPNARRVFVSTQGLCPIQMESSQAALGADDYVLLYQMIETQRMKALNWERDAGSGTSAQPMTLALLAKATTAGTYSVSVRTSDFGHSIVFPVTLASNVLTLVVHTVPPPPVGAAIGEHTGRGMTVSLAQRVGANRLAAAEGVWEVGDKTGVPGHTDPASIGGQPITLELSGLVMLPGIVPVTLDNLMGLLRSYDEELLLCQRYWEPSMAEPFNGMPIHGAPMVAYGTGGGRTRETFKVAKRTAPAMSFFRTLASATDNRPAFFTSSGWIEATGISASARPEGFFTDITFSSGYLTFNDTALCAVGWAANARL